MENKTLFPNAFIVGAQKAGTSSLFDWLSQHPDIHGPSAAKDYPFFSDDAFYSQGIADYGVFFRNRKKETITLAGGVHEMYYSNAIQRMAIDQPRMKIIVLLRNPISRAISAYKYNVQRGIEARLPEEAFFGNQESHVVPTHLVREFNYLSHGLYSRQLVNLYAAYPASQIHVLFFDDLKNNASELLISTFEFLGVDPSFKPEIRKINVTKVARFPLLNRILRTNYSWKSFVRRSRLFNKVLPREYRTMLRRQFLRLNTKASNTSGIDISNSLREKLVSFFKNDIETVSTLMGRDLDHWKV